MSDPASAPLRVDQPLRDLLAERVPVHGFGAQGHYLGLETSVTEADVWMIMPPETAKLQAQAQGYSVRLQGAANLLDESFAAKPAYREMQAVLALAGRR